MNLTETHGLAGTTEYESSITVRGTVKGLPYRRERDGVVILHLVVAVPTAAVPFNASTTGQVQYFYRVAIDGDDPVADVALTWLSNGVEVTLTGFLAYDELPYGMDEEEVQEEGEQPLGWCIVVEALTSHAAMHVGSHTPPVRAND